MCSFLVCLSLSTSGKFASSRLQATHTALLLLLATLCTAKLVRRTPFLRADVASPSGKADVPRIFPIVVVVCHHYHHYYYRHSSLCRFSLWRSKPSPRSSFVLSLSLSLTYTLSPFPLSLSFYTYLFLTFSRYAPTRTRIRVLFPS